MKFNIERLMVCTDCIQAIANDDYSGLDLYYNETEAYERMDEIKSSIAAIDGNLCVGEESEEFSTLSCDCCGNHLAGSRHEVKVLTPLSDDET